MSRKMSFFEFWRRKKERGALLERANQLGLKPSQLKQLLGDSGVRAALQNTRLASLLPPVGTDVFRRFTPASLGEIQRRHEAEEKEREKRKKNKEVGKHDQPKPASELEAGKPLPFIYGDPPPELLNTPLEDLDPYYQSQKTFIVLGKGNVLHRFNAEPACYLLSPFNPLRTVAIKILIHSLFSLFIMLTILTNCVFMVMSDPPAWSRTVEYVFVAIYTLEVVIKVMSRGFCVGKFTFLRDPWNWLDVMVITMAYLTEFVVLWKFRVLATVPRVLKLITVISGMKTTVGVLVQSTRRLAGVIVLMVFCLSVFALIGLQLFMGSLKQKCVVMPQSSLNNMTFGTNFNPRYYDNETAFNYRSYMADHKNYYYLPGQLEPLLCGNTSGAGTCPEGFTCIKGGTNPNYGYTSYDSFGWSLLSMFRLMTRDFWDNLVQMTLRSGGKVYLTFFMLLVFPGCFCLLSLIVAVVAMASGEQEEAGVAEAKQKEEVFSRIVEVLKKREEDEQAACRAALSEKQDGEDKKKHEQENTDIEGQTGEEQTSCPPCWSIFANLLLKWNCCGCWRWLKQRLYVFITNPFFDLGIVVCLVINIVFMAMEHFPMSPAFEEFLSIGQLVFTLIFTAEMVLKLVAMDPYGYFQVGWNIFDSIVVVFSLLVMSGFPRSSLLMRVFRLARWWPSFHLLMRVTWTAVRALRNLTLLLLIVVFSFTVAGRQLFHRDYKDCVCRIAYDCELPRWHMNDFIHTFLVIVRALCGEWIETLWDCMEVSGRATCLIFFMTFLVIVNLLLLNLFLTLLLSSSISDLVVPEEREKDNVHIAISWIKRSLLGKKNPINADHTAADGKKDNRKEYLALSFVTSDQPVSEVKALSGNHDNLTARKVPTAKIEIEFKTPEKEEEKKCDNVRKHPEVLQDGKDRQANSPEDCCSDGCYRCCPFLNVDTSQGSGRVWSNFRRVCFSIVQHRCFEIFIIVIIVLSSVALMFEDIYLPQRQLLKTVVDTADQVFTYLFLLEMLLKWIAFGLKKYFTDAWCWLDFLILDVFLVSLTANILGFSELGTFQFLRTLRALAPLRILSRFEGLRLMVQVLVRTIPSTCDWLLVSLVVWLVFSVVGVNLFGGKFYSCFNETTEERFTPEQVNNKSDCFFLIMDNYTEVRWKNEKFNYDSVISGYLSLMVLESANWMDIMYAAVDSTGVDSQPVYEFNLHTNLYFICFIISCFFTVNFIIRVIINDLQRHQTGKHMFMTEEQQKFSKGMKIRFSKKPQNHVPRPQNQCQAWLFDLVTNPYFEVFMVVLICLNMVVMMIETDELSMETEVILYWFHFVFIIIFLIEFILKVIALRRHYFTDGLNILDVVVIFVSLIGVFLVDIMTKYFFTPAVFPVLRLARISRILHLFRCTRGIRKLLLAFMMSLPALVNIGLLLFLIMVTFSIFGMFNFAYVRKEAMIDDMFNFETFGNSMICLFMTAMSTEWSGRLRPMMNTPPDCDPHIENPGSMVRGDCGSPIMGMVFFISYIFLSYVLLAHLYIAVLLETFNSEDTARLSDDGLQMFYNTWRKFDPDGSQFIQYSELSDFCDALKDPLRIPKPNTIKLIHMDLPLFPGDKIHCGDVLLTLAAQVLDDPAEVDTLKARMEEKFKANSSKVSYEPISSTLRRKQEEVAAMVIQRAYRRGLLQHGDAMKTPVQSVNGGGGVSGSSHPGGTLE